MELISWFEVTVTLIPEMCYLVSQSRSQKENQCAISGMSIGDRRCTYSWEDIRVGLLTVWTTVKSRQTFDYPAHRHPLCSSWNRVDFPFTFWMKMLPFERLSAQSGWCFGKVDDILVIVFFHIFLSYHIEVPKELYMFYNISPVNYLSSVHGKTCYLASK